MQDQVDKIISTAEEGMKKAIAFLEAELTKIRAGKANPQMLDGITVEYYGAPVPLNQVANITVLDARTLNVQPWEKKYVAAHRKGHYCCQYWH